MPGVGYEGWNGHVIVCGLHGLGMRVVEQLREAGERMVVVDDEADLRLVRVVLGWGVPHLSGDAAMAETLAEAGLAGAAAVVCVERTDLQNLRIALLARELRPDVRVVSHIRNAAVGRALAVDEGPGAVLDVAALSAPSIAEACVRSPVHELELGGERFVIASTEAVVAGSLRQLYGNDLAPVAVTTGGEVVVCPPRDQAVRAGDGVTLAGTPEQLGDGRIAVEPDDGALPIAQRRGSVLDRLRWIYDEAGLGMRRALASMIMLAALSTVVLWHGYVEPGMSPLDGLYFSIETIATVGFGDFSFAEQPTWLRVYAIGLMVLGVTNTAVLLAYLTDMLISRRLELASGRRRVGRLSGHVIVVGLGTLGVEVMAALHGRGRNVVVIERDLGNRFLDRARALDVPVIFGDATEPATLATAGLDRAAAVAVLTSDDMVNIETALTVRDALGERWNAVPVVPRVFDRGLARTLARRFGFGNVRSTAELAAPWFVGAALGLDVLGTFTAQEHAFMAGRFTVTPGSGLDGVSMQELPDRTRVLALGRDGGTLEHPPHRLTRFGPGDQAYVIGPYEELMRLLQRSRTPAD